MALTKTATVKIRMDPESVQQFVDAVVHLEERVEELIETLTNLHEAIDRAKNIYADLNKAIDKSAAQSRKRPEYGSIW